MIKNERQFAIVRAQAERLSQLEHELVERLRIADRDPTMTDLKLRAVSGELTQMRRDLEEYESLRSGSEAIGEVERLEDLPHALVRARIAAGLTQAELAARLGLQQQQIQRYEATDYESASLARLIEVANAVGLRLRNLGSLSSEGGDVRGLIRRLDSAGLPRALIERRFWNPADTGGIATLAGRLSHVYGFRPTDVLEANVDVEMPRVAAAAYKLPTKANLRRAAALSGYARYLTSLVVRAAQAESLSLPHTAMEVHSWVTTAEGGKGVTYAAALRSVWSMGVRVVPMSETGGFHAGYWKHDNRPVIVLNPIESTAARWMFDLFHELGHLTGEAHDSFEELDPGNSPPADDAEVMASEFASQAIFGDRADPLYTRIHELSKGRLGTLQRTVLMVARQEQVDAGALALNVAYRLSREGTNWWAAAAKLQDPSMDPWIETRDVLLEHLDWSTLSPLDAELLAAALVDRSDVEAKRK
jgi:transcriptional regulator with XRE-family HTH domain